MNPNILMQIKSVSVNDATNDILIKGYANTTTKDRAGDIIPPSAWKTANALSNYLKNPILLAFHDHKLPIGEVTELTITEEGLEVTARIVKSAPAHIYDLVKDGILKAFSVGFRIHDAEYLHDTDTFLIKDLELLEISVVSVPCNQDSIFSLQKSLSTSEYSELRKKFTPENAEPTFTTEVEKLLHYLNSQL